MAVKQKRGPKHKTQLDRDRTLQEVARLERMRYTQSEIGERLGLSQAQISIYCKQMREQYRNSVMTNTAEAVAEKVAQYDEVIRELCAAWEQSKKGTRTDADGKEVQVDKAGEAVFLGKVMDALKAQRELLGLDAPTKQDVRAAVVGVNVDGTPKQTGTDWAALSGRPPVSDPVDQVPALPEHKGGK